MACSPITSWQIDGETVETVADFIFLGSQIAADGDCSHEIKRWLLLERKVMTNLDSILKSRDITLPTKVCLVILCLPSPRICSNSSPLSWWYYPTILFSAACFSFCLQSFPATGSFLMIQLFASGSQSIRVSASTSVLPVNSQDWSPLRWTGWISLQSKGLSRVFSNTTVQKHQFFGTQLSL